MDPTASYDDVKAAFRAKARKMHPDVSKEKDAHAKFIRLNDAYQVLSDMSQREQYDMQRASMQVMRRRRRRRGGGDREEDLGCGSEDEAQS